MSFGTIFLLAATNGDGVTLTGLSIGGGVVAAVCGVVTTVMKLRSVQKVQIEKQLSDQYVTKEEHRRDIEAVNKRIDDFGPIFNRLFKKLNEIDAKAEDRAEKLHRRLDPICMQTAANSEAISLMKGRK